MNRGMNFTPSNPSKTTKNMALSSKKPQNSGKFARIFAPHSNGHLSPVHEGYMYGVWHTQSELHY